MSEKHSDENAITEDDDQTVISVQNVSKSYEIWSSPTVRLTHSFVRFLDKIKKVLPRKAAVSIERRLEDAFRKHHALHDISFDVKKGESWGVIGYNGSGKTTLLKIISGNLRPSGGRVEVLGKVAILDYSAGLNGEFTGRENIYLKAAMHGLTRKQIKERFQSIVDFADIGEFIEQPVKIYSSGMVARLGFAIMAHIDADILITDEALAVGDALFVQKSMRFLRSFLKKGTFIFVSHSINDIVSLCRNAIWIDNGEMKAIGSASEVADAYLASVEMRQAAAKAIENSEEAAPEENEEAENETRRDMKYVVQPKLAELTNARAAKVVRDPRLEYLNRSPWRNDIKIPEFDIEREGFGIGGARFGDVRFEDENGAVLNWVIGAELTHLKVELVAERNLLSPIVGFQMKDRLGQTLFADNTSVVTVEEPFSVQAGDAFRVTFVFQMPLLPVGEYVLRVAIADGAESDAVMIKCIDDALVLNSITSGARHGLVGVPMQEIRIELLNLD
jgi:homopolymeric O-antigen transport system ATP-binding protein